MEATKKLPAKASAVPWPPLIKMDEARPCEGKLTRFSEENRELLTTVMSNNDDARGIPSPPSGGEG